MGITISPERVLNIVYDGIDEFNDLSDPHCQLDKTPSEPLFGAEGKLDSLELVNLVVLVEERIEDELEVSVTIASEKAMSLSNSPFRDVQSLVGLILFLLRDTESD